MQHAMLDAGLHAVELVREADLAHVVKGDELGKQGHVEGGTVEGLELGEPGAADLAGAGFVPGKGCISHPRLENPNQQRRWTLTLGREGTLPDHPPRSVLLPSEDGIQVVLALVADKVVDAGVELFAPALGRVDLLDAIRAQDEELIRG